CARSGYYGNLSYVMDYW
nr:immunoglobulin heavy chain junction region [Mus musculus]